MNDLEDVRRAQTGDVSAFERVLLPRLPGLIRMLGRLLPSPEDVEDVAQDVCLHALVGLPGLRRPELLEPWLHTVAYNRAMQWQRRRYADARLWPRLWQPETDDDQADHTAARMDVVAALGLLSPSDRDAVVLRYVEGWTSDEIARLQATAAGTVRWRLHRAMRVLRAALSDQDEERSDFDHARSKT